MGEYTLEHYLDITADFKSSFPDFSVTEIDEINVIDESKSCEVGYKARSGEFFVKHLASTGIKEIVYVQPRVGYAGISLAWLCKKYKLKFYFL